MAELEAIMEHIRQGHDFLLSGGAGCGKTHTLVEVLRNIVAKYPGKHVACITYTNAAADEINRRVNHPNVSVSTIHDFLWANIRYYQPQLKRVLAELINDENCSIKISGVDHIDENYFFANDIEAVEYKEYLQLRKGVVSHDEVIELSKAMLATYPKIRHVVVDRNPFILIDEYQDTQREVIEILLEILSPKERVYGEKYSLVGLFGDAMQAIYENGVGDIDKYVIDAEAQAHEVAHVYEVKMEANRRNPRLIIELANMLRTDRVRQRPSDDPKAPNMKLDRTVKEGRIHFLYSTGTNAQDLEAVHRYIEREYGWDFNDTKNTKELDLTYNLIAGRGGFATLNEIYDGDPIIKYRDKIKKYISDEGITEDFSEMTFGEVVNHLKKMRASDLSKLNPSNGQQNDFIANNRDWRDLARSINYGMFSRMYVEKAQLIDDNKQSVEDAQKKGTKRAPVIRHLYKLMQILESYQNNHLAEFFRLTDMPRVKHVRDKVLIANAMDSLCGIDELTIGDVITLADTKGVLRVDDKLANYEDAYEYIYKRVCSVPFKEFHSLYEYLEGRTPLSTQHKTKGTEFDHVLVLMDNGRWNQYNYGHLLSGTPRGKSDKPRERTNKLFYVCCTRAKEDLVVYYPNPSPSDLTKAKEWFGADNVKSI